MNEKPKMTKREAIEELRREADELEASAVSIKEYASYARRAKMRRDLADKFELELQQESVTGFSPED